jgi:NADH-quinone oxidoreductase subunit I
MRCTALQPLTNRSRVVSNKKMTLMERIYLPAIVGGLIITIKHFFRTKRPTIQYPEEQAPDERKSTAASMC